MNILALRRCLGPKTWRQIYGVACLGERNTSFAFAAGISTAVSKNDIDNFQNNGVVMLRDVFDSYWIRTVKRGIRESLKNPSIYADQLRDADGKGYFFNDYCKWEGIPELKEFVLRSPAAEIAGTLMKSKKAMFYHDHVFVKEAGTQRGTPWHQDQPYYPVDGFQNCSIWMPVTPVKKETSLQFLKGSHRLGKSFIPRKFATLKDYDVDNDDPGRFVSLSEEELKEHTILAWDLEPGDCVVFHMNVLHGTSGSVSSITREVLATRWLGDDCVIAKRPWEVSPPEAAFPHPFIEGTSVSEGGPFPTVWQDETYETASMAT